MNVKMKSSEPENPDLSLAISLLKSKWNELSGVGRARAVYAIKKEFHVSNHRVARGVECSESNLRHLLKTLNAPPRDQKLGRNKDISTSEVIRRGEAAKLERTERDRKILEAERARAAQKGADQICKWIAEKQIYGPDGESMIDDVRREFAVREWSGDFPPYPAPAELPLPKLIEHYKPSRPSDDSAINFWYAEWLCRWTYYAFRDPIVRDRALELALASQWKR
jgi:hypothetical protein